MFEMQLKTLRMMLLSMVSLIDTILVEGQKPIAQSTSSNVKYHCTHPSEDRLDISTMGGQQESMCGKCGEKFAHESINEGVT
jgi:hypothetical protein